MYVLIMKYSYVLGKTGMWSLGNFHCTHNSGEG
jgi:hypothetical protein